MPKSNVRIFVKGELIDFGGTVALNYKIFDIKSLTDRKSVFSQTIQIVDSPANRRIFIDAHVFQAIGGRQLQRFPCVVYINNASAFGDGFIVLTDYVPNVGWSANLYGGNFLLFNNVEGDLTDLNLDDLNFQYNPTSAAARSGNGEVSWAPINYGVDLLGVDIEYNYFSVKADRIFRQIIIDAGLTVTWVNNTLVTAQYVPVANIYKTTITPPQLGTRPNDAAMNGATNPIWLDGLTLVAPAGQISPTPGIGKWNLSCDLGISYNGAGTGLGTLQVLRGGVVIYSEGFSLIGLGSYSIEVSFEQILGTEAIQIQFLSGGPTNNWTLKTGSTGTLTNLPDAVLNDTIDVAASLPPMTKKDFLKHYTTFNGLLYDLDLINGSLKLMQMNDLPTQPITDWSALFNANSSKTNFTEQVSDYAQRNNFRYKEAEGTVSGDAFFNLTNAGLDPDKDIFNSPFTASGDGELVGRKAAVINAINVTRDAGAGLVTRQNAGAGIQNLVFDIAHGLTVGDYIVVYTTSSQVDTYQVFQIIDEFIVKVNRNLPATNNRPWGRIILELETPKPRIIGVSPAINGNVAYRYRGTQVVAPTASLTYFQSPPAGSVSLNMGLAINNNSVLIGMLREGKMIEAEFNIQPSDIKFFNRIYINYFDSYFYLNKVNKLTPDRLTTCELIKLSP
jgi:hypothetical protein